MRCYIIQLTLNEGRTAQVKKAFYKVVADGLYERVGLRPEDVFMRPRRGDERKLVLQQWQSAQYAS